MANEPTKLSLTEKIGYSLGDLATNFIFQMQIMFLPYFYPEVFGISPLAMGWMFFITRLWHAVPSFPTVSEVWLRLLETYGL